MILKNLDSNFLLRQVSPLIIKNLNSEPKPNLAIVKGTHKEFTKNHPTTATWVIEVSNSNLELDKAKSKIYANAEVQNY